MAGLRRVALVGAGHMAERHARVLAEVVGRAELVAAAEVNPATLNAFADRFAIPGRYADLDAMIAAVQPDLAIICTPPPLHASQISRCLGAGVWVLCEKPAGGSLADLDLIEAAERASGARCSSVFQWRFGERAENLKELIDSSGAGRLLVVSALMNWYRDQAYYDRSWRGKWSTELGGTTLGAGIHFLDLLVWLIGDWTEVAAMVATLDRDIEIDDVSMATIRFASGVLATAVSSMLSPRQETTLRFDFQQATIELRCLYSHQDNDWTYTPLAAGLNGTDSSRWKATTSAQLSREAIQLTRFLDALDGRADVQVSMADIRPTFDLVSSIYKASATGKAVRRGSIGEGDPFYHHVAGILGGPGQHSGHLAGSAPLAARGSLTLGD
jgi:predicted dehydrogenase